MSYTLEQRYFLSNDHSGFWFLVKADKRAEWIEWLDRQSKSENYLQHPDFAKRVKGTTDRVEFERPYLIKD